MRSIFIFTMTLLAGMLVCFAAVQAQTTTEVQSGTVVYVDGNDLVVRMSTGETRHFNVPEDFRFNVNGKELSVHELKPGTALSRTITTTTTPSKVYTTDIKQGVVWQVQPPTLIVTHADGKNRKYKVPDWFRFDVDGKKVSVFDLRKGMRLTATIVSESESTIVATERGGVSGSAPSASSSSGSSDSSSAPDSGSSSGSGTGPGSGSRTLPKTAGPFGAVGLLGIGFLALSTSLRRLRK